MSELHASPMLISKYSVVYEEMMKNAEEIWS